MMTPADVLGVVAVDSALAALAIWLMYRQRGRNGK